MSLSFGVGTSGPEVTRLNITGVQVTVTAGIFVNSECKQSVLLEIAVNLQTVTLTEKSDCLHKNSEQSLYLWEIWN